MKIIIISSQPYFNGSQGRLPSKRMMNINASIDLTLHISSIFRFIDIRHRGLDKRRPRTLPFDTFR